MRFQPASQDKINFPDGSQGVLLIGHDVESGQLHRLYVSPARGRRLKTRNYAALSVKLGTPVSFDRGLSASVQQFGGYQGMPAKIEAHHVKSFKKIGSGKEVVLENITAIHTGGPTSMIEGTMNGEPVSVYVASRDIERYPQIKSGRKNEFLGWRLFLTGGTSKIALPGNRLRGYGACFVQPQQAMQVEPLDISKGYPADLLKTGMAGGNLYFEPLRRPVIMRAKPDTGLRI